MSLLRWLRKRIAESDSCSDAMARMMAQQPALHRIRYDYTRDTVEVEYETDRMNVAKAQEVIEPLLQELGERIPTCALRDPQGGICEDCPSVQQHGKRWRINGSLYHARFNGQVLTVERAGPVLSPAAPVDRFIRRVKAIERPAPLWRSRAFWEPVLTGVNLLMLVLGGLANSWGAATLTTVAYIMAYLAGGYYGALDGFQTLRERRLDVNLLMIMAAVGAAIVGEAAEGGILLFLFSLSNTLQSFALMRSRRAVRALMALQPELATRLTEQGEQVVPVEELSPGERVLVRPGGRIPTDGIVLRGESHVDQSPITGESVPVHKTVGAQVFAGTVNTSGVLEIEVSHPASETLLHRILRLVEEAQEQKARTQRWLEQFEQRYAFVVIGGSALVAFGLPLLGWAFHDAFYRAMTLLVVASPCALVISTPATLLSAIANAARHGILFKGGEPIERLAGVRAIAIDKTGTLTEGKLVFTELVPIGETPESELWQCIVDVETLSEHPLALVKEAQSRGFRPQPVEWFEALPGRGVRALCGGQQVLIGNLRLFGDETVIPQEVRQIVQSLREQGKTAMLIATAPPAYLPSRRWGEGQDEGAIPSPQWGEGHGEGQKLRFLGVAAVADQVRPTAAPAVRQLKALGIPCVAMLTGDAEPIARAIAQQTGIDRVYADLLPDEKLQVLRQLAQACGPVAMVGDGVNDAPALAAAEVGIAMGAGTDVALETADVALVGNDLTNLPYAVALSRYAMQVLKQNLIFATAVIGVLVVLTFTAGLRLPFGVVGHEGSTLLVVLNGLRLLAFRPERVYS